jgi:hypothetical protein
MTPNTATHQGFFWFSEDAEGLAEDFFCFHAAAWHHVMAGNTSLAEVHPWIMAASYDP